MIYNITGYGKGKTTSAIGIACRALYNNESVLFVQFLKENIDGGVRLLNDCFEGQFNLLCQEHKGFNKINCEKFFNEVLDRIKEVEPDLIVLDELNIVIDNCLLDCPEQAIETIKNAAPNADLYITGRINNSVIRHYLMTEADIASNCFSENHSYNAYCAECKQEFPNRFDYCPQCGSRLEGKKEAVRGREF